MAVVEQGEEAFPSESQIHRVVSFAKLSLVVVYLILHYRKGTWHFVFEFVMRASSNLPAFDCLEANGDFLEAGYVAGRNVVSYDVLVLLKPP